MLTYKIIWYMVYTATYCVLEYILKYEIAYWIVFLKVMFITLRQFILMFSYLKSSKHFIKRKDNLF